MRALIARLGRRPRRLPDESRLALRDLASEASAGILQRPGRSALTMLGTVLGVGAFVAILGLTDTAGAQIDERFSVLAATEVTVNDVAAEHRTGYESDLPVSFPQDATERITALNGVIEGGVHWRVPTEGEFSQRYGDLGVSAQPRRGQVARRRLDLFAVAPGALRAMRPELREGTLYNEFHAQRREQVVVLSEAAAVQLGVTTLDAQPAVFIGNDAYTVVGIISDTKRLPNMLLGVLIPDTVVLERYGSPPIGSEPAQMLIETRLGAAPLIARQAALALRPDAPSLLSVVPPPDPRDLKSGVASDVNALFLLLAALAVIVGALGIANTTLVAILERTAEIGLRRSLGARPRHIAAQFLAESSALGALGGLMGATCGAVTVVLVSWQRGWTAIMSSEYVLPGPVVGGLIGLLAGLYPALRAARIEPVDALRH